MEWGGEESCQDWRYAGDTRELEVGRHEEKKDGDGKWDRPVPPAEKDNPKDGGKHEKGGK
ncbi:hypothetical protein [Actinomadura sp. WMMB 499]|uniref:hypothetical protein n=1 Tax=Actinomadura sp. WMMB 499 TaxID=1219491 RepID=UPI0012454F67|nr:hypothetical protein [Actinomadura sp. WMMB 499]QFG21394.1 hypothetical protein F7P10_09845 [Actinomadura sp. WMMB 499]